jgi:hypothetical protein
MSIRAALSTVFGRLSVVRERRRGRRRDVAGLWCDQGWIVSLSPMGAKMMSAEPLQEPVRIRLGEPPDEAEIRAKVIWWRQLQPDLHESGIEFTVVNHQAKELLTRTLDARGQLFGTDASAA